MEKMVNMVNGDIPKRRAILWIAVIWVTSLLSIIFVAIISVVQIDTYGENYVKCEIAFENIEASLVWALCLISLITCIAMYGVCFFFQDP